MPCDYRKYPRDWFTVIRPNIMQRSNNYCERCGVKNYTLVQVFRSGIRKVVDEFFTHKDATSVSKRLTLSADLKIYKYSVVVLTVAHLDHNIENNDYSNLKALCQKCHNRHDIKDRVKNRKQSKTNPTHE